MSWYDDRDDLFAHFIPGNAEYGGIADLWMLEESALNVGARDYRLGPEDDLFGHGVTSMQS